MMTECMASGSISASLLYGNVKVTWEEAHDICNKSGGKLADYSSVLETDSEQIRREVTSGQRVWINGFHNHTSCMSLLLIVSPVLFGCMDLANSAVPNNNFGRDISLLKCIDFCGFPDYVALKMFSCYCVSLADVAVATNPFCSVRCLGDMSDNCGGTSQTEEVTFGENDKDKNCVYITKNSSENSISGDNNAVGDLIWGTEDCEISLNGFVFQSHFTSGIEDRCDAIMFGEMGEINDTIIDLCTERHTVLCEIEDNITSTLLPSTVETTELQTTIAEQTTTEAQTTTTEQTTTEAHVQATTSEQTTTEARKTTEEETTSEETTTSMATLDFTTTTEHETTEPTTLKPIVKPKVAETTSADTTTNSTFLAGGTNDQKQENVLPDDGKLHISAVILIIVLAVLLLLIFILLIILLIRKRNRNKDFRVQIQNTSYLNKGFSEEGNVLLVSKEQEQTPPLKPVRQKSTNNGDIIKSSSENVNLTTGSNNSLPKLKYTTFKPLENNYTPLPKAESLDIPFIDASRDNLDRIVREPNKTDVHSNTSLNVERPLSRENSPNVQKASSLGNIDSHDYSMIPNHGSVESLDNESSPTKVKDTDELKEKRKNSDASSSSSNTTDLNQMDNLDVSYENGMGNFTTPGSNEMINM
ncbi:hypothetical protein KUTeg_019134 [Tegillarca granosa]|uniref:WSC domain-containing protein n=1 Tax=Tegillarca granosa TaxID=220873 RepID=A0ABQ9EBN4_TEGGR|nr:hypothetical protein KUTeg_019134 [Tegillarca granosa]